MLALSVTWLTIAPFAQDQVRSRKTMLSLRQTTKWLRVHSSG